MFCKESKCYDNTHDGGQFMPGRSCNTVLYSRLEDTDCLSKSQILTTVLFSFFSVKFILFFSCSNAQVWRVEFLIQEDISSVNRNLSTKGQIWRVNAESFAVEVLVGCVWQSWLNFKIMYNKTLTNTTPCMRYCTFDFIIKIIHTKRYFPNNISPPSISIHFYYIKLGYCY